MQDDFTIKTDNYRLLYSVLLLLGSIFAVVVSIRVLQQDTSKQKCDNNEIRFQIKKLDELLQSLKNSLQ